MSKGAGPIRLPPLDGLAWSGKVSVGNGGVIDIPLALEQTPDTLDGALWWPDPLSDDRNRNKGFPGPVHDIDLYLLGPSGTMRAASKDTTSIFERARVVVGSESDGRGTWTLRIIGANVSSGQPQTVYWTARARLRKGS